MLAQHQDILTVGCNMTLTFDFGLDLPVPGGYKYRDLALQVGRVSVETVIYGYGSYVTNQYVMALQITVPSSCQRGRLT
jgi:hypothetical protein